MRSVMTLTPNEQRQLTRALAALNAIFGDGSATPRRSPRSPRRRPDGAKTLHRPARSRLGKNPLVHVDDAAQG